MFDRSHCWGVSAGFSLRRCDVPHFTLYRRILLPIIKSRFLSPIAAIFHESSNRRLILSIIKNLFSFIELICFCTYELCQFPPGHKTGVGTTLMASTWSLPQEISLQYHFYSTTVTLRNLPPRRKLTVILSPLLLRRTIRCRSCGSVTGSPSA